MLLLRCCHRLTRACPFNTQRYSPVPHIVDTVQLLFCCKTFMNSIDNSQGFRCGWLLLFISIKVFLNVLISLMGIILVHRHRGAPALASHAFRLWSSSSGEGQRSYLGASWKHALVGLVAGTGAVLAYSLHHHKVRA